MHATLKLLCQNYKIKYVNKKLIFFLKFNFFYFVLKSIYFFIFNILKNHKKVTYKKYNSDISFFSYFLHFNNINNRFKSSLWDGLPDTLKKKNMKSNWFHFFTPSSQVQNISDANNKIIKFNNSNLENHKILNSYISRYGLFKVLFTYFCIAFKSIFISKFFFFYTPYSKTTFLYFLHDDFCKSFYGEVLLYNLFIAETFDQLLSNLPIQKQGYYILENQCWEKCLNILWKKHGHGRLCGYMNSSIRFWDLRYFKTKKEYSKTSNPDFYLVNGKYYYNILKKNNYPVKKTLIVEALRYLHLKSKYYKNPKYDRVLIVGDINSTENNLILYKIKKNIENFKMKTFFYKPHPANTLNDISKLQEKYGFIKILSNKKKINFEKFKRIICTNSTSALIDCIIKRLNFCSIRCFETMDLYPFYNIEAYKFRVFSDQDLLNFINRKKVYKQNFFDLNLNKSLKQWRQLIFNDRIK